jgi:2,3,4,5-tetrahydropyridine-2,6-dicarboxylate N-succinyltransferase
VREVIEETDKEDFVWLLLAPPTTLSAHSPMASDEAEGGTRSKSEWVVNEWVKQAILMYFGIQQMQTWNIEPFEFYDKMLLKKNYKDLGVRAVPHAVARYGAYVAKNVVLMPS